MTRNCLSKRVLHSLTQTQFPQNYNKMMKHTPVLRSTDLLEIHHQKQAAFSQSSRGYAELTRRVYCIFTNK